MTSTQHFNNKSITFRFLMLLVPGLIILLMLFGLFSYNDKRQHLIDTYENIGKALTKNTNQALRIWIDGQVRVAQSIAADPRVIAALSNPEDAALVERADRFCKSVHKLFPFYENLPLAVKLPKGKVLKVRVNGAVREIRNGNFLTDTVGGKTIGKCSPKFSYIKNIYKGKKHYISEVYPSILRGNPIFVISAPVYNGKKLVGVVVIAPQMSYFTDLFLEKNRIGKTGYLAMVDDRKQIIAHPDKSLILKKKKGGIPQVILDNVVSGTEIFEEMLHGKLRNYIVSPFDDSKLNLKHDWYIFYTQEQAEIVSEATLFMYEVIAVIFVISLLMIAGIYFLARYFISGPLNRARNVSEQIEKGNLALQIAKARDDEIGKVLGSLQSMAARLHKVVRGIKNSSENIASASEELSSSTESFSNNAQSQAAAAEEITATIEEVSAGMENVNMEIEGQFESITNVSEGVVQLDELISTMARIARTSLESTQTIVEQGRSSSQALDSMNQTMTKITESSHDMTRIVNMISDISEQINLLSLNAAIEAARAGESGRGFAVVADEISKLADQTASSIQNISHLIVENSKETEKGMRSVSSSIETIAQIIESVSSIGKMIEEIHRATDNQIHISKAVNGEVRNLQEKADSIKLASGEQKNAVNEIVRSVSEINELTQFNAAGAEQMEASTKNLLGIAEELALSVDYFSIDENDSRDPEFLS